MASWQAEQCAKLMAMQSGMEWVGATSQIYTAALDMLGERVATRAVNTAVLTLNWRPSIPELLDIAVDVEAPAPCEEDALREWQTVSAEYGVYGHHNAEHPFIRERGNYAAWSHPLIGWTVETMGGYVRLIESETPSGVFFRQFKETYASLAGKRRKEAAKYLHLPPAERPQSLFPAWQPFEPEAWRKRMRAIESEARSKCMLLLSPELRYERQAIPADARLTTTQVAAIREYLGDGIAALCPPPTEA